MLSWYSSHFLTLSWFSEKLRHREIVTWWEYLLDESIQHMTNDRFRNWSFAIWIQREIYSFVHFTFKADIIRYLMIMTYSCPCMIMNEMFSFCIFFPLQIDFLHYQMPSYALTFRSLKISALFCLFICLCWVFLAFCRTSLLGVSGGYSLLQCAGCSLWWLLILQRTGSRAPGLQ